MKDRVALHIIKDAFAEGLLQEGGLIAEGTAGSTGLHTISALHSSAFARADSAAIAVHSFSACPAAIFGLTLSCLMFDKLAVASGPAKVIMPD